MVGAASEKLRCWVLGVFAINYQQAVCEKLAGSSLAQLLMFLVGENWIEWG